MKNIITILGRDQACNEETWTRKVIKDTTPPEIEIVEPKSDDFLRHMNLSP
ncbi:MAG: hypothetical protein R2883_01450 [Caldisericia bacterium]